MNALVVPLTERQHELLKKKAKCLGVSLEELVQMQIEEWLEESTEDGFLEASLYVMNKNKELYERLS